MAARRNCRFYPRLYEAAHGCGRLKAFRLYSLSSSTIRLASKRRIQVRVLLVDDDAAIARSIELMLKIEEINVYRTDLGEEGVDLGKIYDYDVILLDLTRLEAGC